MSLSGIESLQSISTGRRKKGIFMSTGQARCVAALIEISNVLLAVFLAGVVCSAVLRHSMDEYIESLTLHREETREILSHVALGVDAIDPVEELSSQLEAPAESGNIFTEWDRVFAQTEDQLVELNGSIIRLGKPLDRGLYPRRRSRRHE